METSLRKGSEQVHITYLSGDYTNNLLASDFILEQSSECVILSMNFSPSENVRNKSTNTYADVQQLREEVLNVELFQISKQDWLNPLRLALEKHNKVLVQTFENERGMV